MKKAVLLLLFCTAVSLVLGFLDVSLSDYFLYQNQVTKIHYWEALGRHLVLGVLAGLFFAMFPKRLTRGAVLRLWTALLLFFILAIKIQLVWLSSTFLDSDSLGATLGLGVVLALLYWFSGKISVRLAGAIAMILTVAVMILRLPARAPDSAQSRPNVVLIAMDTVRADHLGCYGYPLKTTPHLDELAMKGVLFEQAITPSPWTAPSHAAIFTGLFPAQNQVHERNIHLDPQIPTLASLLSQVGYQTVGFTNNLYVRRRLGLANGFQDYEELWGRNEISSLLLFEEWIHQKRHPREDAGAQDTFQRVKDWFRCDYHSEKPFFLFINYMEAHAPYAPLPEYKRKFVKPENIAAADRVNQDPEAFLAGEAQMSDRDFALLAALYDAELNYLDDQIGNLLAFLSEQPGAKNTLFIVLSDHGENFGDHGLMSHEISVHDTLIRVPMILVYPPVFSGGRKVRHQVMTLDLFPTILKIAGVKNTRVIPGLDLSEDHEHRFAFAEYNTIRAVERLMRRFPAVNNPFLTSVRDLLAIRMPGYKLYVDGNQQHCFLLADEDKPLKDPEIPAEVRSELDRALETWMKQMGGPRKESKEPMTPEEYEELRALNYVN